MYKFLITSMLVLVVTPISLVAQTMEINLQKAIDIALEESPTMRIAEKDVQLKEVASDEAWQSLIPTLDASLSLAHNILVASFATEQGTMKMGKDGSNNATGVLTLAMPVFAPTVYQNMKLTKEDIILAREKARASKLDLINQVKKAYFSALLSKDSYEVMQRSYKVAKENFDIVEKKFNVGTVSEYDKITAEVQMRSMNSSMVSAETGLRLAMLQLKVLMGIKTDIELVINDHLTDYESTLTLANAEANVNELDNNSTIKQIDMNSTLLGRTRKLLYTNFMPTATLALTGQYNSYSNPNLNLIKYSYIPSSTLTLSINVPIFHIGNWTKLKTNRIQQLQLADTRENTHRQLSLAMNSYRENMLKTLSKLESDREAVRQADKAVSISTKRYDVGRGTILELNQSETALTQAELTYRQSIYDFLSNKADLDLTLGRE